MIMTVAPIASERRDARCAINTIRRVVQEVCESGRHLGEMRPTMAYGRELSHISDMLMSSSLGITTLRGFATCMVLLAPVSASHVSDMMRPSALEEVLLLDFHAVLSQELTILLGKCLTTMVLFLLGNIPHYHVFVSQAIRKARILFGPSIEKRKVRVGLEPLAGRDLDFLDKLGHRQGRWQRHEKMYMVRHTANAIETASDIVDKTMHIGIEFSPMLFGNGGDASMGPKDNMIECLCVTHTISTTKNTDYCYPSPRRGVTHSVQTVPCGETPCGELKTTKICRQ